MAENIVSAIHGLIAAVETAKTEEESATITDLRQLLNEKEAELVEAAQERDSLLVQTAELRIALEAKSAELQVVLADRDGLMSDRDDLMSDRDAVIREREQIEQQVELLLEQLQKVQEDLELYVSLNHQQHEMLEESLVFQARALHLQFKGICADGQKLLTPAES